MTNIAAGTAGVSNTSQYETAKEYKDRSVLDKDSFLQLLITQLANQDPTNPMDDREFISQMAQFSSLEQMNNVAREIHGLRTMFGLSSNMIGKTIDWQLDDEEGTIVSGVVDSILLRDGEPLIVVGDKEISYDSIIRVYETPSQEEVPVDEIPDEDVPDENVPGEDTGSEDGEEA